MALASNTVTFISATPADGVSSAIGDVPENCHTLIIRCPASAANSVLVGFGEPGVTVLAEGTNAVLLAAGEDVTWAIGTRGQRQHHDGVDNPTNQLIAAGSGGASSVFAQCINGFGASGVVGG